MRFRTQLTAVFRDATELHHECPGFEGHAILGHFSPAMERQEFIIQFQLVDHKNLLCEKQEGVNQRRFSPPACASTCLRSSLQTGHSFCLQSTLSLAEHRRHVGWLHSPTAQIFVSWQHTTQVLLESLESLVAILDLCRIYEINYLMFSFF